MTSVFSLTDTLRKDKLKPRDDNQIDYSSVTVDWRARYDEVLDMLSETRAELDDFHQASKELEAELENELQRTEKSQQELKVKVSKAEVERDEWKGKFMSLQTTHNTTSTSLQRELDRLRQDHQMTKIQLRELEMGNDDLERNERAVSSSLAEMEAKYSKALEEKILLEHELLEKASLEEESQRLKDELRDANVEISILKDQLANVPASDKAIPAKISPLATTSDDNLLNTAPPPDLQLSELSPTSDTLNLNSTPRAVPVISGQSMLQRAGFQSTKPNSLGSPSSILRSSALTSINTNISSPRLPTSRPIVLRGSSGASMTSTSTASTSAIAKNKGVQMVSEMRARVRNLEQKIHTRVPRLRMGSITGRPSVSGSIASVATSSSATTSNPSTAKTSLDSLINRRSIDSRRSNESEQAKIPKKDSRSDASGWVLIMEDSPSPQKDKEKERKDKRRLSSPTAPTAFRPSSTIRAPSPSQIVRASVPQSNSSIRRPQSRLSAGNTTPSSIPTPTSRPATPTLLPVPSASLHASSSSGFLGMKRSTGPGCPNPYSKRSSLGVSTSSSDNQQRLIPSMSEDMRSLPQLPGPHANVTMRPPNKFPSNSTLAQSRIGRPSSGLSSARKSGSNGSLNDGQDRRP